MNTLYYRLSDSLIKLSFSKIELNLEILQAKSKRKLTRLTWIIIQNFMTEYARNKLLMTAYASNKLLMTAYASYKLLMTASAGHKLLLKAYASYKFLMTAFQ